MANIFGKENLKKFGIGPYWDRGLVGSWFDKQTQIPEMDMTGMTASLDFINKQYESVKGYFSTADKDLNTQFAALQSRTLTDAINQLANTGIYDSPVSEYQLNRTRTGLAETYATAKSSLAGQQMGALSSIDAQKINYYQTLADMQYQQGLNEAQAKTQLYGSIAGIGGSLIGMGK